LENLFALNQKYKEDNESLEQVVKSLRIENDELRRNLEITKGQNLETQNHYSTQGQMNKELSLQKELQKKRSTVSKNDY